MSCRRHQGQPPSPPPHAPAPIPTPVLPHTHQTADEAGLAAAGLADDEHLVRALHRWRRQGSVGGTRRFLRWTAGGMRRRGSTPSSTVFCCRSVTRVASIGSDARSGAARRWERGRGEGGNSSGQVPGSSKTACLSAGHVLPARADGGGLPRLAAPTEAQAAQDPTHLPTHQPRHPPQPSTPATGGEAGCSSVSAGQQPTAPAPAAAALIPQAHLHLPHHTPAQSRLPPPATAPHLKKDLLLSRCRQVLRASIK